MSNSNNESDAVRKVAEYLYEEYNLASMVRDYTELEDERKQEYIETAREVVKLVHESEDADE